MRNQRDRKPVGRPRLPEGKGKLYTVGAFKTVRENYEAINKWAARSGRSVARELEQCVEFRRALQAAYPPEIAGLLELIGRAMLDVGTGISGANRFSGHGIKPWLDDPYAYNQAVTAAQHILELSRYQRGDKPHGLFASPDYPKKGRQQFGKLVADGILEVMRRRHESDGTITAGQWAPRVREQLGSIGDRLDSHPIPGDYIVSTDEKASQRERGNEE